GAKDTEGVARNVQRGLVLSLVLSVPGALLLLNGEPILRAFGQPAEVIPQAGAYTRYAAPGVLPFYVFLVFRQSLQAFTRMAPIVWSIVISNVLNAALNWVLIFGHLGAPPMGVAGASIASTIGRWIAPFLLLALSWHQLKPALLPLQRAALEPAPLGRMVRLGAPIGLQMLLEYTAFGTVGLLMGRIGTTAVAAHQVALNLASLTFMVPLGVGQAGAVLVGHAVGSRDALAARGAARAAVLWGVGFMALAAVAFLLVPRPLATFYTTDLATIELAAMLIPVAGVFQLFDGMQAVTAGLLRGAGDTRVPMLTNLAGFWLFGIPLCLALAFGLDMGPMGLWWGLAAALSVVATLLARRTWRILHQPLERVVIEAPAAAQL
ncbi:MAG TPA: MATE family efflux transporter, partial [Gemmatimonadales bacterium]|nr:MATE family efflux transporter [Gemmatimonadales bacterium]